MIIGGLALIMGIASLFMGGDEHAHHHAVARFWSNILINGFFFFGIAVCATFFMALNYAAESGWWVVIKRILEAIGSFMPYGAVVLFIVLLAGAAHMHHLYHWMDPAVSDPDSPLFDEIIAGKTAYLNVPFMIIRQLLIMGGWIWMWKRFRTRSLEEDLGFDRSRHFKNVKESAIFLIAFGYPISTFVPWDWIMSIDTHWFSTLFGWYVFSGLWLSAMIVAILMVVWLKSLGRLQEVNDSHIHDLGKWMFAISFLWSYLFFSQFMLIWYANIPEEVTYFQARINEYPILYWGMFFVNFIFPMIALMDRDKKRNRMMLTIMGIILFCGHWVDVYMLVTPGTMKQHGHIGLLEVGMALGFVGLFVFVITKTLAKAPLVAKNHPFFDESVHHEIH
ncbi:MAG: quinol:cytochrome C oxidoreductase [Crocinitomicaceae bacterium]|nr:quinol:cytochrome C oxidoreductase [Crocinitomicaceae bacterium]